MKIVTMNPGICVGCNNCQYACSFTQKNDFKDQDSNIRVYYYPDAMLCVPITCLQCGEAWCMEICPAAAISKNEENGAVEIDPDRCAGCKMCMLACPFGNIHFDVEKQICAKCDLCGGDPTCVKYCTSGALRFEDESTAFQSEGLTIVNKIKSLLTPEKYESV